MIDGVFVLLVVELPTQVVGWEHPLSLRLVPLFDFIVRVFPLRPFVTAEA